MTVFRKMFVCDPAKNRDCSRENCMYRDVLRPECYLTNREEYAELDENGAPIRCDVEIYKEGEHDRADADGGQ